MDTYSFGVVLLEIASCALPYAKEREDYKKSGGKGVNPKLMREIANGYRQPELTAVKGLRRFHVGAAFKKRESMQCDMCKDTNH